MNYKALILIEGEIWEYRSVDSDVDDAIGFPLAVLNDLSHQEWHLISWTSILNFHGAI
jgi:hypothetical protein